LVWTKHCPLNVMAFVERHGFSTAESKQLEKKKPALCILA